MKWIFSGEWPWFHLKYVLSVSCGSVAVPAATDDTKTAQVAAKYLGSDARLPKFKSWFCHSFPLSA